MLSLIRVIWNSVLPTIQHNQETDKRPNIKELPRRIVGEVDFPKAAEAHQFGPS
jgi:hypothetical protein